LDQAARPVPNLFQFNAILVLSHWPFWVNATLRNGITIAPESVIGAGALVREHCRIGAWSAVGMGAAVLHDVPAAEVWAGNPARRLRALELPPGEAGP
jgi:acetyltransferase-like isoleucine patch superfamily enzyme